MSRRKSPEDEIARDEFGNRFNQERLSEQRDKELRELNAMNYFDILNIPPHKIPEGKVYRFIRYDVRGEPDSGREMQAAQLGWSPVPASRHPEHSGRSLRSLSEHARDYIAYKGVILCERDKVYDDIQMKAAEEVNMRELNQIPGIDGLMNEPTMPGAVNNFQTSFVNPRNRTFGG